MLMHFDSVIPFTKTYIKEKIGNVEKALCVRISII